MTGGPALAGPPGASGAGPSACLGRACGGGCHARAFVENVVFKLADQRPDLLTGGNPATGQPQPYGSAGVDINCAPTANLAPPAPNSQFPPR